MFSWLVPYLLYGNANSNPSFTGSNAQFAIMYELFNILH